MGKKTRIVAALGEITLLLPSLLNEALAANDRAKYRLTLLQSAKARADLPAAGFSTLSAERIACAIPDPRYDEVVAGSVKHDADAYAIPRAPQICSSLQDDLSAMIAPLEAAAKPAALPFRQRLDHLCSTPWCNEDGTMTGARISWLGAADAAPGDSVHLLVMELHKALNRLQAAISTENISGASTYGLKSGDRALVAAFMKGLNRTLPLKFDHPGLGTTATRAGGKLIIQNDIGATDAHVLVLHVEGVSATVTYSDNHLPRLLFFQNMFARWQVDWGEVLSRTDRAFESGVYHLCLGTFAARDKAELKRYLAQLGSRLVFLIDWNRARKRLQLLVSRPDAVALLRWAAESELGHLAFLKAGGERMVFDALQFVAGGTLTLGISLDEILGREAALSYLQFILKTCAQGMLNQKPLALIRDEARVELYRYYHDAQQNLLDLAANHASLAIEIATGIRDGLLTVSGPETASRFERIGQRAKEWERKADELVIRARELAPQSEQAAAIRQLLEVADDIPDELEDAAFHLTLLIPEQLPEELRLPLAALAQQLVDSSREYLKAIENARGINRSGSPDDMRDFLKAVHRMVAIEEQSDTSERLVRKALVTSDIDYRQSFVVAQCARKLEAAADALMHTGMTLRDQILGKVVEKP
ncbi:MAG: hypothetical protein A2075_03270 [Geobacteraceae bacterium GWC2_58_44]|nr:MAG: hypothetical protein A2075_03270 [Geobacteraceae bacterium GWC2_58_44]HBG05812.1 hypothetical protein [Geobacter sp.]